jgi:hypothetical protein
MKMWQDRKLGRCCCQLYRFAKATKVASMLCCTVSQKRLEWLHSASTDFWLLQLCCSFAKEHENVARQKIGKVLLSAVPFRKSDFNGCYRQAVIIINTPMMLMFTSIAKGQKPLCNSNHTATQTKKSALLYRFAEAT